MAICSIDSLNARSATSERSSCSRLSQRCVLGRRMSWRMPKLIGVEDQRREEEVVAPFGRVASRRERPDVTKKSPPKNGMRWLSDMVSAASFCSCGR
jgi:hypothetical protein